MKRRKEQRDETESMPQMQHFICSFLLIFIFICGGCDDVAAPPAANVGCHFFWHTLSDAATAVSTASEVSAGKDGPRFRYCVSASVSVSVSASARASASAYNL